jgi:hypothetical protein
MHNSRSVNSMFLTIKMFLNVKNSKFADLDLAAAGVFYTCKDLSSNFRIFII